MVDETASRFGLRLRKAICGVTPRAPRVTLIVTINGRESIWLLADRRLSCKGRGPRDDARKVMFLETKDGVAILGYAGLGATALGTEPADWMSAVLRGRSLPLEQSLGVLADAMKKQFPRHMIRIPGPGGPGHNVLVTAFVDDKVRFYTIDLAFTPDKKQFKFRYTRHVSSAPVGRTPRIGIGGRGALHLFRDRRWLRPMLRLVGAYERGQVTSKAVSDHLAKLNLSAHRHITDGTVGPSCIVAWRNRKGGHHKGGGGHQFYTDGLRDANSPSLPAIANGIDINAIVGVMVPRMAKSFEAMRVGDPPKEFDWDELNAELVRLPDKPDEQLR